MRKQFLLLIVFHENWIDQVYYSSKIQQLLNQFSILKWVIQGSNAQSLVDSS